MMERNGTELRKGRNTMGRRRNREVHGLHSDGGLLSMEVQAEDGTWRKIEADPIPGPISLTASSQAPAFDAFVLDRTIRLSRDEDRWFVDPY